MKAKFKVGDTLRTTIKCKAEGRRLFGSDFTLANFKDVVVSVYENTNDEKDGMGDIIQNQYTFSNGDAVCEAHLEKVGK